ncbi:MAG: matrixin family metalloprotease [Candidatus Colwellbacteria bacterium]|nr:matrixin family metalloprotease [Candidatus Colwellbacteria bacterium]
MNFSGGKKIIVYISVLIAIFAIFSFGAKFISLNIGEVLNNISLNPEEIFSPSAGCRGPAISYGEGDISPFFGISSDTFLKAIREAEDIWEKGSGENLFSYSDTGEMKINLVFDERQEETEMLKNLFGSISSQKERFEAVKAEYERLTAQLRPLEEVYNTVKTKYELDAQDLNATVEVYNIRKEEYEDDVVYWNERGGAPEKEYRRLSKEYDDIRILYDQILSKKALLEKPLATLEKAANDYNLLAGRVNTIGGILNRLAADLNINISSYNRVQGEREEFVTGRYVQTGGDRFIDIYQFYDYDELVTIIAHEMGHSLGLGHGEDPNSIMYSKIGKQSNKLSAEDINMLKELCAVK